MRIKLYDIHGKSASANYQTLVTGDDKYIYWDDNRFGKYEIGDVVFWMNRNKGECLFTKVDSREVSPIAENGVHKINDIGYSLSFVPQELNQFENFFRFKIVTKAIIPGGWNYNDQTTFASQLMAYIIYEENINAPNARISKINDLELLFPDGEAFDILEEAKNKLSGRYILNKDIVDAINSDYIQRIVDESEFDLQLGINKWN
jgi:hypothetical protein